MTLSVSMVGLGCGWGSDSEVHITSETIDISANANMFAIHGQTGFGKTTLLNVLSAFMAPNHGSVAWHVGDTQMEWSARNGLANDQRHHLPFGIARQANDLPAGFRLHETLSGLLRHRGFKPSEIPDMIQAAISPFIAPGGKETASGLAAKFPHELSGGQRQRMALACAIVHQPSVLFLDEPTASLNAEVEDLVLEALGIWLDGGTDSAPRGLVFATHDLNAPAKIAKPQTKAEGVDLLVWDIVPPLNEAPDAPRILVGRLWEPA
jgi:ABC-type lipoprotein export system ATPase subunit